MNTIKDDYTPDVGSREMFEEQGEERARLIAMGITTREQFLAMVERLESEAE